MKSETTHVEDWKYQLSLALPEGLPDAVISGLYDIVEAALNAERERCAKIAEDGDYQCEQGNCHASIAAAIRGSNE